MSRFDLGWVQAAAEVVASFIIVVVGLIRSIERRHRHGRVPDD